MKLAKAIEILELNLKQTRKAMPPDCHDAVQLAVEALHYCVQVRRFPHNADNIPIPGEDTE